MDFNQQAPIYLQIADYILDQVLSQEWKAGERIKSVRELAADIEVNPNTVVRTYGYLSDQDIIYNKRGVGYFLADDALDKVQQFRKQRFIQEELPPIFNTMHLLDISMDDLIVHYKSQLNEKK